MTIPTTDIPSRKYFVFQGNLIGCGGASIARGDTPEDAVDIVRKLNAHDALVTALTKARETIRVIVATHSDLRSNPAEHPLIRQIEAALALANGEVKP